jgi:hypothetical protein
MMIKLNKANKPGVSSNSKHITVNISASTAIVVWKPKEVMKTLLNPITIHYNGSICKEVVRHPRNVVAVRNKFVADVESFLITTDVESLLISELWYASADQWCITASSS